MKIIRTNERKAISPIIATVLIIAATLIAFAAIGGYMFGIFGSATNTANVQETNLVLNHLVLTPGTGPAGPAGTCGGTATSSFVTFSNSGTAAAVVTGLSFNSGASTFSVALPAGGCPIGPSGSGTSTVTIYLTAGTGTSTLVGGTTFTGIASVNNGEQAQLTGALD